MDNASKGPVTISRNREQFALLKREKVAELVMATLQFGPTLELVEGALCVLEGREPSAPLKWMKAFDRDDITKMVREILDASIIALRETSDWEAVNIVIHQWRESGLVAMSGVLAEAIESPAEESPLTDPQSVLESETDSASPAR